jgi:hypothetical protein
MKKFLSISLVTLWLALLSLQKVLAQNDLYGTNDFATGNSQINIGTKPLVETIAGIVNIVLGFLGVIAVLLILYAGWLWMTSQGNSEKIQRAKLIIVSAVIGLAIIFSAYALSRFIIRSLGDATGINGTNGGTVVIPPGGEVIDCPPPASVDEVKICSLKPVAGKVGSDFVIGVWNIGSFVDAATSEVYLDDGVNRAKADIASCGGSPLWKVSSTEGVSEYYKIKAYVPNLAGGSNYWVEVKNGTKTDSTDLGSFSILDGVPGPSISCLRPDHGAITASIIIEGRRFKAGGTAQDMVLVNAWEAGVNQPKFSVSASAWADTEITFRVPSQAISGQIQVQVADGANPPLLSNNEPFIVDCLANSDCASGCCPNAGTDGWCAKPSFCSGSSSSAPHINSLNPSNGAVGNLITILGYNFCDDPNDCRPGEVLFSDGANGVVVGESPVDLNNQCSNYWTDTAIIIGVPVGAEPGQVTMTTEQGIASDNAVGFNVNGLRRPGICALKNAAGLVMTQGAYEDEVYIHGLGFLANDSITFGTFAGYGSRYQSAKLWQSHLPNIKNRADVEVITNAGEKSNPFPFTALEVIGGKPVINEISPPAGPIKQYLTIKGANFGASKGSVKFKRGAAEVEGDFSFPAQCTDKVWRNDTIIVKVPTGLVLADYRVQVIRNGDAAQSNEYFFEVNNDALGPGLCLVKPNNGPAGMPVDFFGDNFGTARGSVVFHNNQTVNVGVWNNQQVLDVPVPNAAATGPVEVRNSAGGRSNSVNFRVGSCGSDSECTSLGLGDYCCSILGSSSCSDDPCGTVKSCSYSWTINTKSLLQVVDHGPECDNACSNAEVFVDFNSEIGEAYLLNTNLFTIQECADETCNPADLGPNLTTLIGQTQTQDLPQEKWHLVLNYDDALQVDTYYLVTIDGSVENANNAALGSDFTWKFKVGQGNCAINRIVVQPANFSTVVGKTIGYLARAYSVPGICSTVGMSVTCTAPDCIWSPWQSSSASARILPAVAGATATVSAEAIGENINITAQATQNSINHRSFGVLNIKTAPLRIVDYNPRCANSCRNTDVWVDFNYTIPSTYIGGNGRNYFTLEQCNDPDCNSIMPGNLTNVVIEDNLGGSGTWRERIIPFPAFVPGVVAYYKVTVSRNIQNTQGAALGADFTWNFGLGPDDCEIDRIGTIPVGPRTAKVGDEIKYLAQAYSVPNACYPMGQPITCVAPDCVWNWNLISTPVGVASTTLPTNLANPTYRAIRPSTIDIPRDTIGLRATQDGDTFATTTEISVSSAPVISLPRPQITSHEPNTSPVCINAAASVSFNELMDHNSLRTNLKLYYRSAAAVDTTCLDSRLGYWWCVVSGSFSFIDTPTATEKIKVIFSPNRSLAINTQHLLFVGANVKGKAGGTLADVFVQQDINGDATPDGWGYTFDTRNEVCNISYTVINPSTDIFTCATNNCPDDELLPPAANNSGNQHSYVASTYGVDGTLLAVNTHKWVVSDVNLLSFSSVDSIQQVYIKPTPNKNGRAVISVEVKDVGRDILDTAQATAEVTLFMCARPWPAYNALPWSPSLNPYNYSTYYCQQLNENSTLLPVLNRYVNPTSPNPLGVLDRGEHIFLINYSTASNDLNLAEQNFGSLAFNSQASIVKPEENKSWFGKLATSLFRLKKSEAQAVCPAPPPVLVGANLISNSSIILSKAPDPVNFPSSVYQIWRQIAGSNNWVLDRQGFGGSIIDYPISGLTPNTHYEFRMIVFSGGCWTANSNIISVYTNLGVAGTDIIAIRVMDNSEHLSIGDWYAKHAPNPQVKGTSLQIDGYEALEVDNTIYVAATNLVASTSDLFTNIYIIAHNIGARPETLEIYKQLLDNFRFNSNYANYRQNNVCTGDVTKTCSNDFDCGTNGPCQSRGLKLRRDLLRFNDLIHIKNLIDNYGQNHRACSNNSNLTCTNDDPCLAGGGRCVPYYPILNAGTFVNGMTNSNWPSWLNTFTTILGETETLPKDPVNLFNGCPSNADPKTCWDQNSLTFTCPRNSLIYFYKNKNNISQGDDYVLGANFEYDADPFWGAADSIRFRCNLRPGSGIGCTNPPEDSGILNLASYLGAYCWDNTSNPTAVGNPRCGNGIIDVGEDCDGGFRNLCDATLGDQNWWNEKTGGCYPPGTYLNNALVECKWYTPSPALTAPNCGNYCGNNIIDKPYENCDGGNFEGLYTCYDPATGITTAPTCSTTSCQPICASGQLAPRCGDGLWNAELEMCDASADPNGLLGWSCGSAGIKSCNNCQAQCSNGERYRGVCGDGNVDAYCRDVAGEIINCATDDSACSVPCTHYEYCEPSTYIKPDATQSSSTNQYLCDPTYCTYIGGWCGDEDMVATLAGGTRFNQPEQCDINDWAIPLPVNSGPGDKQYECDSCLITGGFCGDGIVQDLLVPLEGQEQCDDGDVADINVCNNNCKWSCDIDPAGSDGALKGFTSEYEPNEGFLFRKTDGTFTNNIELRSGDRTTLDLGQCRIAGNVSFDVVLKGNEPETTGIVFVSDRSSSMTLQMNNLKVALNMSIDQIFAENWTAKIALVSYTNDAHDDVNDFFANDISFMGYREKDDLEHIIGLYTATGGTDHASGLALAKQLLDLEDFQKNVIVFMTDGKSNGDPAEAFNIAKTLKATGGLNADIFTIALTGNTKDLEEKNSIKGFMNAISSSGCYPGFDNYGDVSEGACGTNGVNCFSLDNASNPVFEECDPSVNGDECSFPTCQWVDGSKNRAYESDNDLGVMYNDIFRTITTEAITVSFMDSAGEESPATAIDRGDDRYSVFVRDLVQCNSTTTNNRLILSADFPSKSNTYLEISNPIFELCHWWNCPYCY